MYVGGANVPALNDLLSTWDIAFSSEVLEGEVTVSDHKLHYASGTAIARFPQEGSLLARDFNNQGLHAAPSFVMNLVSCELYMFSLCACVCYNNTSCELCFLCEC